MLHFVKSAIFHFANGAIYPFANRKSLFFALVDCSYTNIVMYQPLLTA